MGPPLQLAAFHVVFGFVLIPALCEATSNVVRFELFHRHHPELSGRIPAAENQRERVQELVRLDSLRQQWISMKLGRSIRRRASEAEASDTEGPAKMRIASGIYALTGQYFVIIHMGTPAQKFLLVADTGSDLTWMRCRYGCRNCKQDGRLHGRRIFRPDESRTFSPLLCSSPVCSTLPFALQECPTPSSHCTYHNSYEDGTESKGFFANESATIYLPSGRKMKLRGLIIGCSETFVGSSFRVADGILGLGHSLTSFAIKAMQHFGGKFSYCLVDHLSPRNVSNYLIFGSTPESNRSLTYTNLVADEQNQPYYDIQVLGITVDGVTLKIPPMVWDMNGEGGVILDSGTTITVLAEPAFEAVYAAFKEPLKGFEEVSMSPFKFCIQTTAEYSEDLVPKLAFHFAGPVQFTPHVNSYMIDVGYGVRCLGFLSAPWPTKSIIGNILQQEYFWEFDLIKGRVGFQPSTCLS